MKEILNEFHELLKKKDGVAILKNEDGKSSAIVSPKDSDQQFIDAVEEAISSEYDCSCDIRNATQFDYGYVIDMDVRIRQDDDVRGEKFELIYATKY